MVQLHGSALAAVGSKMQLSHVKNHLTHFSTWALTVWWHDGMILMAAHTSADKNHYFIHELPLHGSQDPRVVLSEASVYGAAFTGL